MVEQEANPPFPRTCKPGPALGLHQLLRSSRGTSGENRPPESGYLWHHNQPDSSRVRDGSGCASEHCAAYPPSPSAGGQSPRPCGGLKANDRHLPWPLGRTSPVLALLEHRRARSSKWTQPLVTDCTSDERTPPHPRGTRGSPWPGRGWSLQPSPHFFTDRMWTQSGKRSPVQGLI